MVAEGLRRAGYELGDKPFFDTLCVDLRARGMTARTVLDAALEQGINLRMVDDGRVGLSLDETTTRDDVRGVLAAFGVTDAGARALPRCRTRALVLTASAWRRGRPG